MSVKMGENRAHFLDELSDTIVWHLEKKEANVILASRGSGHSLFKPGSWLQIARAPLRRSPNLPVHSVQVYTDCSVNCVHRLLAAAVDILHILLFLSQTVLFPN